jgi:hypothetical protein
LNLRAELAELAKRIAELESRCGVAHSRRWSSSRSRKSKDRFRAGKRLWDSEDDALLRKRYPHEATEPLAAELRRTVSSIYTRAMKLGLAKTDEYLADLAGASKLRDAGAPFRFARGHVPANKGLRRPGYAPGRMRETQFKKGHPPLNHMPLGSTRRVDGYLYRKIADTWYVPWTRNWIPEHVRLWEEANGPVPPAHVLAFKNGDRDDICLDNLELITRRELMARNTIHNLPKELASTIQLLGVLKRQINKRKAA